MKLRQPDQSSWIGLDFFYTEKVVVKADVYKRQGMKKAYPEYDCVRQLAKEHHKTFDQTFRIVKAAAEQLL